MWTFLILLAALGVVLYLIVDYRQKTPLKKIKTEIKPTNIEKKEKIPITNQDNQEENPYQLNWSTIESRFPYKKEITAILNAVSLHMTEEIEHYQIHGLPVNPYAFALAVRQAEGGRAGREFGVLHPKALEEIRLNPGKGLSIQLEWYLGTFKNDVRRWNLDELANVGTRKKRDFHCFVCYFGAKYAPIGARNDPTNLNSNWVPNVKRLYTLYTLSA